MLAATLFREYVTLTASNQLALIDDVGLILLVGIISAKIAKRVNIPMIIPLLLTGILLGPAGLGFVQPGSFTLSLSTMVLFVIPLFLFAGGLNIDLSELRKVAAPVFLLVTLGVVLTALATAFLVHFLLHLPLIESYLLGTIVASTDPSVVIPVIERLDIGDKLVTMVKAESALNDPTSIVLFTVILSLLQGPVAVSASYAAEYFVRLFFGGVFIGVAVSVTAMSLVDRFKVREQLNYISLIVFIVAYTAAQYFGTSGIAASVVAGMVVGSEIRSAKFGVLQRNDVFYLWDNVSFLSQMVIFLLLGLYATRSMFSGANLVYSVALSLGLIFLVRPAAVWASTLFQRVTNRERAFVSWIGARGAVAAALASAAVGLGVPHGNSIFALVLITVVFTILFVSLTTEKFASKMLHVSAAKLVYPGSEVRIRQYAVERALERLEGLRARGDITQSVYEDLKQQYLEKSSLNESKLYGSTEGLGDKRLKELDTLLVRRDLLLTEVSAVMESRREHRVEDSKYTKILDELGHEVDLIESRIEEVGRKQPRKDPDQGNTN